MDKSDPGGVIALAIGLGVLALFGYGVWWRLKYRPRYLVDEHGERQRVTHWNRGQPVYTPKTWRQRIHEEAVLRSKRRREILLSAPFVIGPYIIARNAFGEYNVLLGGAMSYIVICVSIPVALWYFIPGVLKEMLYQTGYQGMDGAKVRDRAPTQLPGRDVVEEQKAHGDAQLASEAEALALLTSKK